MNQNKQYLLQEYFGLCPDGMCDITLLTESEKKMRSDGALLLSGKFQEADTKNQNGRLYPKAILAREVDLYQKMISEKRALGELDHPESSIVSLSNASHMVLRLWWEGNSLMGVIKILTTPKGNVLRSFVNDGVNIGISSRALGNVNETREGLVVSDDLQLVAFDAVCDPSVVGAFMQLREAHDLTSVPTCKADRLNRLLNEILRSNK